jgi:hypothetical protein
MPREVRMDGNAREGWVMRGRGKEGGMRDQERKCWRKYYFLPFPEPG